MLRYLTLLLLTIGYSLSAQDRCGGSLGPNLFDEGDFGTGAQGILLEDPGIAPGYQYVTFGPPNDGQYLITRHVNTWSMVWDTWLRIPDNSSDPNGYMMVVNASFDPGIFYEEIVMDICENTQFEFTADIINMIRTGVNDHSDPNVAFLIDDEIVIQTGNIPKDERWHTYSYSFTTEPGQTSVKLTLQNNAPGGIGNDLALDNITFRACGPPSQIALNSDTVACAEDFPLTLTAIVDGLSAGDQFYQWQIQGEEDEWIDINAGGDQTIEHIDQTPGRYSYRFGFAGSEDNFNNEKCRFYSEPISITVPQREYMYQDTICGGTGIIIDDLEITQPGVYTETLVSSYGCDSIVTYVIDTVQRATVSATLSSDDPGCFGGMDGLISAADVSQGYPPYHLNLNGQDYEGLSVDVLPAGEYHVQVQDRYGCFYEEDVSLFDPDEFRIDLGDDLMILLGEEVEIAAMANQEVASLSFDIGSDTTGAQLTILPIQSGFLSTEAVSADGCSAADSIYISVDTDVSIYVPNAFSPNEDGRNDKFRITAVGKSLQIVETLQIYSRWGELLADVTDIAGWDGRDSSGRLVQPGVYMYRLSAILINGERIDRTGSLTLIH